MGEDVEKIASSVYQVDPMQVSAQTSSATEVKAFVVEREVEVVAKEDLSQEDKTAHIDAKTDETIDKVEKDAEMKEIVMKATEVISTAKTEKVLSEATAQLQSSDSSDRFMESKTALVEEVSAKLHASSSPSKVEETVKETVVDVQKLRLEAVDFETCMGAVTTETFASEERTIAKITRQAAVEGTPRSRITSFDFTKQDISEEVADKMGELQDFRIETESKPFTETKDSITDTVPVDDQGSATRAEQEKESFTSTSKDLNEQVALKMTEEEESMKLRPMAETHIFSKRGHILEEAQKTKEAEYEQDTKRDPHITVLPDKKKESETETSKHSSTLVAASKEKVVISKDGHVTEEIV